MRLDESMLHCLAAEVRIVRKKLDQIGSKPYTHHDAQFAVAVEDFIAPQPCDLHPTSSPFKEIVFEDLPHQRTECRLPVQLALDALVVRSGCGDYLHSKLNPSAKDFVPTSANQRVCIIDDADELFELDQQIRVSQPPFATLHADSTAKPANSISVASRTCLEVDVAKTPIANVAAPPCSSHDIAASPACAVSDDDILEGYYWKHVSRSTAMSFDQMSNIGDLASVMLHGHIVTGVLKHVHSDPSSTRLSTSDVAELVGRLLPRVWSKRDLSPLLRIDYEGLIDLLKDLIVESIAEVKEEVAEPKSAVAALHIDDEVHSAPQSAAALLHGGS
jgi:hypothetical protein